MQKQYVITCKSFDPKILQSNSMFFSCTKILNKLNQFSCISWPDIFWPCKQYVSKEIQTCFIRLQDKDFTFFCTFIHQKMFLQCGSTDFCKFLHKVIDSNI